MLAAEAFALPLADPAIRPRPVVIPDDPTGIGQPHDVLAAEEFAMPAVGAGAAPSRQRGGLASRPWAVAAGIVLLAILLRRRRS